MARNAGTSRCTRSSSAGSSTSPRTPGSLRSATPCSARATRSSRSASTSPSRARSTSRGTVTSGRRRRPTVTGASPRWRSTSPPWTPHRRWGRSRSRREPTSSRDRTGTTGCSRRRSEWSRFEQASELRMPRRGDISARSALALHRGTANRSAQARPVVILGVDGDAEHDERHDMTVTRGVLGDHRRRPAKPPARPGRRRAHPSPSATHDRGSRHGGRLTARAFDGLAGGCPGLSPCWRPTCVARGFSRAGRTSWPAPRGRRGADG